MGDGSVKMMAIMDLEEITSRLDNSVLTMGQVTSLKDQAYEAAELFNSVKVHKSSYEEYKEMWDRAWREFKDSLDPAYDRARLVNHAVNEIKGKKIALEKRELIKKLADCVRSPDYKNTHKQIQELNKEFWDLGFSGSQESDLKDEFKTVAAKFYQQAEAKKIAVVERAKTLAKANASKKFSFKELETLSNELRTDLFKIDAGKTINNRYRQDLDKIINDIWASRKSSQTNAQSKLVGEIRQPPVSVPTPVSVPISNPVATSHPKPELRVLTLEKLLPWHKPDNEPFDKTKHQMKVRRANDNYIKGFALSAGQDYVQDFAKARVFFEKAASEGHTQAMRALGVIYQHGFGVSVDKEVAQAWFGHSISLGDAQTNMLRAKLCMPDKSEVLTQEDVAKKAKMLFSAYFQSGIAPGLKIELEGLTRVPAQASAAPAQPPVSSRQPQVDERREKVSNNLFASLFRSIFGKI